MTAEGKCKGTVWDGWHRYACSRKASTEAGYCKSHDPAMIAERTKKRDEKWEKERAERDERWRQEEQERQRKEKILAAWDSIEMLKARIAELEAA